VDTRIVRIFNTYGPRMHIEDGRVVPNFLRQAICHEPLTGLRRRAADPQLLLCRRSGGGHLPPAHVGRA